jgi:putative hydrolase of the HAD superfamily
LKAHLFTDADNTLWDTDKIYASAQLDMLRQIERMIGLKAPHEEGQGLAFLRGVDQKIASAHPDHLRYPPVLLARGLSMVLGGRPVDEAVAQLIGHQENSTNEFGQLQDTFIKAIQTLPPLREGVREGLVAVGEGGIPVTIVTEERVERCCRFVAEHRLEELIFEVVSVRKSTAAYLNLKQKTGAITCFMVGDQIDRDIVAANAAGFFTFYFPGGFAPYWNADFEIGEARQIKRYDAIVPEMFAEIERASHSPRQKQ